MMIHAVPFPTALGASDRLVIAPYHPDRLRRPSASPGAIDDERFGQTFAWNVFRTLELLPPAFWLRRLQARLHIEWFRAAPETVRVQLWPVLSLPPAHHLDGARPDV